MKFSKLFSLISMAILLLGLVMVTSCVSNQTQKSAELTPDTVRAPGGNPEAFWDELGWTDMTAAEQALWKVLGWDEDSWEGEAKKPASEDKYWRQLNDKERDAAEKLGYNKRLWDES